MNFSWKKAVRSSVSDTATDWLHNALPRKRKRIKTAFSIGFSVLALFLGSVGLTGCNEPGEVEQEEVEIEKEEGEIEVEED